MCFINTRSMLAKLILNKVGNHFVEAEELQSLSNNSSESRLIQEYLSQTSLETLIDIRQQAQKFPLESTTIKHHLLQVYDSLILYSPSGCDFSRSMVFIQFMLEVCYRCVECNQSNEIRSIHEFSSRLLERDEESCVIRKIDNSNWTKYVKFVFNFMNIYNKFV